MVVIFCHAEILSEASMRPATFDASARKPQHPMKGIKTGRLYSLKKRPTLLYNMTVSDHENKPLRSGFTTGACAAAATKAALQTLLTAKSPSEVEIALPSGRRVSFPVKFISCTNTSAICAVTKDAGDDPDITNGLDILSRVSLDAQAPFGDVQFMAGQGVGRIAIRGHELPLGEAAINPVPRQMIRHAVIEVLTESETRCGVSVTISVPGGEDIARRTLNPRLGIEGGISILGTSGIVVPYSEEAYLDSIRQSIQIAMKNGCSEIVLNSGSKSETFLKTERADLPELAFVHYGNWIGRALEFAKEELLCKQISVGVMLAKATKLAAGNLETSSRQVSVDRRFIADLAKRAGYASGLCEQIAELKLVRGITELIPFGKDEPFYQVLAETCYEVCKKVVGEKPLVFYLISMSGELVKYEEKHA
ncbi:cobalt-precorrin-5B (C(1))-methyltransferase CbiD [Chloroherpeton thalassium]|nr:cobalt-precorrin-5B (C(1))-methyltransferase CbiD [Chloroherpeton thalassium]